MFSAIAVSSTERASTPWLIDIGEVVTSAGGIAGCAAQ